MRHTEAVEFTNMCMIVDRSGNVLVQDRVDPSWPGITFPGGHVEPGEAFTDSVIREVFEETGLTVSNLMICGIKDFCREDGSRYVVLLYKTTTYRGDLRSSSEGQIFWTPLVSLLELKLASGMENMLKVFLSDDCTEDYFQKDGGKWIERLL